MNFSAKNVNGIEKIVATQSRIFIITAPNKIVHATVPIKIPLKYKD
jgi:hypothetical protein